MLSLDRAVLAWLRRHHVPLDAAFMVGAGAFLFALSMTVSTYQQFYMSRQGLLPAAGALLGLAVGLGAAVVARRWEVNGTAERGIAVLARVALTGAVMLVLMAPMRIAAA